MGLRHAEEFTQRTSLQVVASLFCMLISGIPVYVAVDVRSNGINHPLCCAGAASASPGVWFWLLVPLFVSWIPQQVCITV